MNKELITFLKDLNIKIDSQKSNDDLFTQLLATREFRIGFKEWGTLDEKKFRQILKSSNSFEDFFQLQLNLNFATPIK